jgi:hypothetical protein
MESAVLNNNGDLVGVPAFGELPAEFRLGG